MLSNNGVRGYRCRSTLFLLHLTQAPLIDRIRGSNGFRKWVSGMGSKNIGAEIFGADVAQEMGNQTFQEIHDALMKHQVLFFRDQ